MMDDEMVVDEMVDEMRCDSIYLIINHHTTYHLMILVGGYFGYFTISCHIRRRRRGRD